MADETNENTDTTSQAAQTEPAPQSGAPALTLEQVQQMIAEATQKAHDSAYAKARRELQGKQPKQPAQDKQPEPKPATDDALSILALRDAFDDATGDLPLSAKQKKFLRDRVMKERPDDVASFIADAVEVLGVKQSQPQNPNPAAPTPQQPQQAKTPQPTPPPPAPTVPDREGEPAFRELPDEVAQDMWKAYVRRKGAVPGNPYDPRNRSVWRELRNRFEAEAAISRVLLGARRG